MTSELLKFAVDASGHDGIHSRSDRATWYNVKVS